MVTGDRIKKIYIYTEHLRPDLTWRQNSDEECRHLVNSNSDSYFAISSSNFISNPFYTLYFDTITVYILSTRTLNHNAKRQTDQANTTVSEMTRYQHASLISSCNSARLGIMHCPHAWISLNFTFYSFIVRQNNLDYFKTG